ncbi:MAG: TetR family transcriptional regulator [Alphaproteobacteria bacterium]|nr:TetR family transcriptional regulator [Alphaproteobacteria bacterium]
MARKARSSGKAKGGRQSPPPDPVDAALALAAERGWRETTLRDIAERSGRGLAELYRDYPGKGAILAAFMARIDERVLVGAETDVGDGESARDRLFEVIMRRFDALAPHREALRAILRDLGRDPVALCEFATGPARRSLAIMLTAAGLDAGGLAGLLRRKGLGVIYADTFRVWLNDESADQARTMAHLDRRLRQAEQALAWRRRPAATAAV